MISKLNTCAIMGLFWVGAAAAAPATDTKTDALSGGSVVESGLKRPQTEDPCDGLDLGSIAGLRGTIISRVYPDAFSEGDLVTVCGRGLSMVKLLDNYQLRVQESLEAGNFIEIGDENNKRGWKVQVFGLTTSATGDRITFVVGGLFESTYQSVDIAKPSLMKSYHLVPAGRPGSRTAPNSAQGELKLVLSAYGYAAPKVIGPIVSWKVGGPKLRRVYGRFFNSQEPFVITPQGTGPAISPELGAITIEGGNLRGATYRVGDSKLTPFHVSSEEGTSVVAYVPPNAASGSVCASNQSETHCGGLLSVQPAPTITKSPQIPWSVHTTYVIEGSHLKPNVPGLTYRLALSGLTGDENCGQVLKVSEHTAQRIAFSLGDVSSTPTVPPACLRAANYQTPQENPSNLLFLMARYKNHEQPLFRVHYFLTQ